MENRGNCLSRRVRAVFTSASDTYLPVWAEQNKAILRWTPQADAERSGRKDLLLRCGRTSARTAGYVSEAEVKTALNLRLKQFPLFSINPHGPVCRKYPEVTRSGRLAHTSAPSHSGCNEGLNPFSRPSTVPPCPDRKQYAGREDYKARGIPERCTQREAALFHLLKEAVIAPGSES